MRIEKSVKVQGRGKRADYAFFTAPNFAQAKFMAEAKKPSRQLENAQDCFQAIRYGWNSSTPISVLTDFEQLLVLDSRYKPSIETATQRIIREKSFRYDDYADEEKFREIYYLFSREAVGNNSLETFAQILKGGRGARQSKLFNTAIIQPIDEEFLAELDEQRLDLARAFKNRNPQLDGEILTEITQRALDRLVFLRFLEDKLVEPDSVIDNLGKRSGNAWRDFIGEMPRLNQVYNGTLFRPHAILDDPNFMPDERAFEQTRDWLAHANSPYDFNSIPIHILGSIYERFLGKTIEATDKRATVVDKPEVRKAGGVYYTPEYIVRYIVAETVGRLILDKSPEQIAGLRFADIAAGSGSFLLGIFDYLIAYHVEYFSQNKTRRERAIKQGLCRETVEGNLQLTINYKREILLNNIYGVDLDAQAVEVAQLSLYLKLLEEETTATKQQFLAGFREQLLPSLNRNIVHGNSLIDYDIMDGMLFDTRELKQLNPMNFEQAFPEIFAKGGFDAIVGNPPWGAFLGLNEKQYLPNRFSSFQGNYEIYLFFIEQALTLTKQNGFLSFVTPDSWIKVPQARKLREIVLNNSCLTNITTLPLKVFQNVSANCIVFVINQKKSFAKCIISILLPKSDLSQLENGEFDESYEIETNKWTQSKDNQFQIYQKDEIARIIEKLKNNSEEAVKFLDVMQGIVPYSKESHSAKIVKERGFHATEKLSDEYGIWIQGRAISRYAYKTDKKEYLKYGLWLHRPRKSKYFNGERILIQEITGGHPPRISACFCDINLYHDPGIISCLNISSLNIYYLLAIINCGLISWYHQFSSPKGIRHTFPKVLIGDIRNFPIREIDFANPKERTAHNKLVELVEKMLAAKKSLAAARTDRDKTFFERYCESLDKQIDALVYGLYELTPEEIKVVENS